MKDSPEEIVPVMNLILPRPQQLKASDIFEHRDNRIVVKPDQKKVLKNAFRGRVSLVMAMESSVPKIFVGDERIGELKQFTVARDYMHEFQSKYYAQAMKDDMREKGIYTNSRQAILFVFPDGSYGRKGFEKYVRKKTDKTKGIGQEQAKPSTSTYSLRPELVSEIKGETHEEMLENLSRFSSSYAVTIKQILEDYEAGKSSFVYSDLVKGSGGILFSLILSLFGFAKGSGRSTGEQKRYFLASPEVETTRGIQSAIGRFNRADNMNGKIISVIIGSYAVAEGVTFKNVQSEQILTPHWNYAETAQVIARGWRLGSHEALIRDGQFPEVRVYQRVSIPKQKDVRSLDLMMYEVSESKDVSIKAVERLIREAAFDCSLAYARNRREGIDGQRGCDYMDCDYVCDGVPLEQTVNGIPAEELDYSTYQLYYQNPAVVSIAEKVVSLFRTRFQMTLREILGSFPDNTNFEVVTALRNTINRNVPITNKYGIVSYLREEDNTYFLVSSLAVSSSYPVVFYTKNVNLETEESYEEILKKMRRETVPAAIRKACESTTIPQLQSGMAILPLFVREDILEKSLIAKEKGIETTFRDLVLELFDDFYENIDGVYVSWLLLDKEGVVRCMNPSTMEWADCTDTHKSQAEASRRSREARLREDNPYGYYGLYNVSNNEFCIMDATKKVDVKDKRKRMKGKRCINWTKDALLKLVVDVFKLPKPADAPTESRDVMEKALKKTAYGKKIDVTSLEDSDIQRIFYWSRMKVREMCSALQLWFEANDMLVDSSLCGVR